MKVDTFENFLKKKKEEETQIDWAERERDWVKSVNDFYNNIKIWLKPFIVKGLLIIDEDSWTGVDEERYGNHDLKKMVINIGKGNTVTLTPRAKLLVGGFGRIDMKGPNGAISIIPIEENKWKFKNMVTLSELWDVDAKSFEAVIQDLVNG